MTLGEEKTAQAELSKNILEQLSQKINKQINKIKMNIPNRYSLISFNIFMKKSMYIRHI